MALPIAARQFVTYEQGLGLFVGHAQQSLCQTHQRHTFFTRQTEFMHQGIDTRHFLALGAHL